MGGPAVTFGTVWKSLGELFTKSGRNHRNFYTIINWKIKLTRYWLIYNSMWKMWSTGVHYYM